MKAIILLAVAGGLITATLASSRNQVEAQYLDQQEDRPSQHPHHYYHQQQQQQQRNNGRLTVVDKTGQQSVSLSPGLLEESLLKKGSFDFNSKLVKFDKLKVLGNIYVHRINGRNLRDHYSLKGSAPSFN